MKPLLDSKAWTSVTLDLLSSLWKERKELGATKRGNRKEREEENGEKQGRKEDKGVKLERKAGSVRGERGREIKGCVLFLAHLLHTRARFPL